MTIKSDRGYFFLYFISVIDHIYQDPHFDGAKLYLHYEDLNDAGQLTNLVYNTRPEEMYHLAAQSPVRGCLYYFNSEYLLAQTSGDKRWISGEIKVSW
ncbi:MAG: GDP-mannose 4,6-dehydratase [Candidatus Scalindua sp.]|nr:GDP-mannose 4,6-dehydratase [Candidatus Scalindua sp.]